MAYSDVEKPPSARNKVIYYQRPKEANFIKWRKCPPKNAKSLQSETTKLENFLSRDRLL